MKTALLSVSLIALTLAPGAQGAWQRLGSLAKHPIDGASSSIKGTKIAGSNGLGQPESLISDDVAASSQVGTGKSDATIDLGRQVVVELVTFVNEGAEGRASVEGSVDSRKWVPLSQTIFTQSDRLLNTRFAGAQVKYVRLSFDLAKGGSVKSLNVFGSDTDNDFKVVDATPEAPPTPINVAGGLGGSRVIYINPNPTQGDEFASKFGSFEFPESADKFRTVIYDFGKERTLTEIGSVHSPRPVRFYAYAFEKDLPEKEDWRGRKSFDPIVFDTMKPVATVEDARGMGYVKAKLTKSVRARYVALRWEPDFNPPAFTVSGVSIIASGLSQPQYGQGSGNGSGAGEGSGSGNGSGSSDGSDGSGGSGGSFNGGSASPFSVSTGGYGSSAAATSPTDAGGTTRSPRTTSGGTTQEQNASP